MKSRTFIMNFCLKISTICMVFSKIMACDHIGEVLQCPRNKNEWDIRAEELKCTYSAKKKDVYHCVLDDTGTKLFELCAPAVMIPGQSCVEFDCFGHTIHKSDSVKCMDGPFHCPFLYWSNVSYKYQSCYDFVYKINGVCAVVPLSPPERCPSDNQCWAAFINTSINTGLLVIMLSVLVIVCRRLNSMKNRRKKRGYTDPDNQSLSTDITT